MLQCRYKVLSSRSDVLGDEISIHHAVTGISHHYIGIKYFGSGKRFTKWKAECWIEEPNTNNETKINRSLERAAIIDNSSSTWGVQINSSATISESTILRIEITITEWAPS